MLRERVTMIGIHLMNCPITPLVTNIGKKAAMVVKTVAVKGTQN